MDGVYGPLPPEARGDERGRFRNLRRFEVTEAHLALIRRFNIQWDDCETGAPEVDPKRPYGNSDVAPDVANALGESVPDEEEDGARAYEGWEDGRRPELMKLHRETEIALSCVLQSGEFSVGIFTRKEPWAPWKKG